MRRLLPIALLVLGAGCLREPDPITFSEPSLAVHGLVLAGGTQVRVSLMRAFTGEELPTDATVMLESGGTTITLAPVADPADPGCYGTSGLPTAVVARSCYGAVLPQPVAAGTTWQLRATVSSGELVTGTTRVPAAPTVVRPAARERVPFTASGDGYATPAQIPVEWQTAGAPRVEVGLGEGRPYRGGQLLQDARCILIVDHGAAAVNQPSGSRVLLLQGVYCFPATPQPQPQPVAWDSVATDVVVTAYDSAYAQFALHGESFSRGSASAALQGAYGVFGSAATTRREIVIVAQQ